MSSQVQRTEAASSLIYCCFNNFLLVSAIFCPYTTLIRMTRYSSLEHSICSNDCTLQYSVPTARQGFFIFTRSNSRSWQCSANPRVQCASETNSYSLGSLQKLTLFLTRVLPQYPVSRFKDFLPAVIPWYIEMKEIRKLGLSKHCLCSLILNCRDIDCILHFLMGRSVTNFKMPFPAASLC